MKSICHGQSMEEVVAKSTVASIGNPWQRRLSYMQPKIIVELGTGQGASGTLIMAALALDATFMTVNYTYPEEYRFGEQLDSWKNDKRLTMLVGDTLDPKTIAKFPREIDLLFHDTHHYAWHAAFELCLYQEALADGAIVICDDIGENDMWLFWESLHYDKWPAHAAPVQGLFRYDRSKPYTKQFPRGLTGREG